MGNRVNHYANLAARRARRLARKFALPPKLAAVLRVHLRAEARGWDMTHEALALKARCSERTVNRAFQDERFKRCLAAPRHRRRGRPEPPPPHMRARVSVHRVHGLWGKVLSAKLDAPAPRAGDGCPVWRRGHVP